MSRISAVSVIEIINGTPESINTFPDTPDGNKLAEKHFETCIKENNDTISDEDIDVCIEDGIFTDVYGYEIYIMHS